MKRRAVRLAAAMAAIVLSMILAWDLRRRPNEQWSAKILIVSIDVYQRALSPHLATAGVRCRFEPTCSRYAEAVIRRDGALKGSWHAAVRLVRCGPWTPAGTKDQP